MPLSGSTHYYPAMPLADLGDVQLYHQVRGDGPPLLGVMGFALDQRYWASVIPAITKTHSFIAFDNRGIGRSTGGPPTTIDQMADDAIRLLDHLGIDKTVLFGVSMGGAVAQRLILDHPDRVSALILAITWARPIEFMRRQHEVARKLLQFEGAATVVNASLVRMFTPKFFEVGRETVDQMVAAFFADSAPDPATDDVLHGQLDAIDKHDTLHELHKVSVPSLVLGAKMDQMVPGFASEEIAAAIPRAELVMFETGHGCMVEEMEAFNAAVSGFLAKLV